jgi:hypothetical protein
MHWPFPGAGASSIEQSRVLVIGKAFTTEHTEGTEKCAPGLAQPVVLGASVVKKNLRLGVLFRADEGADFVDDGFADGDAAELFEAGMLGGIEVVHRFEEGDRAGLIEVV